MHTRRLMARGAAPAATATGMWCALAQFGPNELQLFIIDGLNREALRVRGLSDLLDTRAAAAKSFEKASHAKESVEFEAKKFAEKGKADKAALLEPKIKQARPLLPRRVRARWPSLPACVAPRTGDCGDERRQGQA
jgi:hypothetical protein